MTCKHVRRLMLLAGVLVLGCGAGDEADAPVAEDDAPVLPVASDYDPLDPSPPVLTRLTRAQYHNTVRALLGDDIAVPATLEPDTELDGLLTVGASLTTVSPRGVELYEEAARSLGSQAMETEARRARVLPCSPSGASDSGCMQQLVETFGRRAWRRPLTAAEVGLFTGFGTKAAEVLGDFHVGAAHAISALLQSPHFIYRVELGEADPEAPGKQRYRGYEMATRLAYFLWNTTPDDTLLDAAEAGELSTEGGVAAQTDRLLSDPRARNAVRNFFSEWLQLHGLDEMKKDPNIFKHYSADVGDMAREETLHLVEHMVFEQDADLLELFTTRTTFVNRRLAAIYNVPSSVLEGFGIVELPEDGQRRGILGHVSFLALHSHPVSSSATLRGIFLRETMLCDAIPPPPAGLNTALPQPDANAKTLRERLTVHMQDPSCAGCHRLTDIVGLGFENFDGMGRFRLTDNDAIIDPSGDLDTVAFNDFAQLTQVVAENPKTPRCFVRKLFSYAMSRPFAKGDTGQVTWMTDHFEASGRKILTLMRTIAVSEAFRRPAAIESGEGS